MRVETPQDTPSCGRTSPSSGRPPPHVAPASASALWQQQKYTAAIWPKTSVPCAKAIAPNTAPAVGWGAVPSEATTLSAPHMLRMSGTNSDPIWPFAPVTRTRGLLFGVEDAKRRPLCAMSRSTDRCMAFQRTSALKHDIFE